jgi:hypothetical protein
VRGRDDLVAGADAQRFERQVRPAVAELTAMASMPGAPRKAAKSCSKRRAFGPVVTQPDFRVSMTSAISSSPISGRAKGRKGRAGAAGARAVMGEIIRGERQRGC